MVGLLSSCPADPELGADPLVSSDSGKRASTRSLAARDSGERCTWKSTVAWVCSPCQHVHLWLPGIGRERVPTFHLSPPVPTTGTIVT